MENNMDVGLKFMAFIAMFGIAILCFFAINAISAITKLSADASRNLDKLVQDFDGLQKNVNVTLENLNSLQKDVSVSLAKVDDMKLRVTESLDNYDATSTEIRNLTTTTENGVKKLLQVVEPFEDLAGVVYERVSAPVNQTLQIMSAVGKAVSAFTSRFNK